MKVRTIDRHERLIEKMLPALGCDPGLYDAALVRRVLLQQINQLSLGYAKTYVTTLRVFLRFLAAHGRCQANLDRAVPVVPEWKLSALPRYLEADDIERVIDSCDLSKPHGVRDRAILLLLARLGLRGGDITAMRVGDLDWDEGTVKVLGKGRRKPVCLCLKMPGSFDRVSGESTASGRYRSSFSVHQRTGAPFCSSCSVSDVVRLALERAGIVNASEGSTPASPFRSDGNAAFRSQSRCDCDCASTSID
ncbi:MAG: tyrosine-type recombinase/integrase [Planctomycetaceae bacterium]